MYIEKILNNNVVMTLNHLGEEVVYMGCGLAFNKKIGDKIEEKSVEKEFVLKDTLMAGQFQQLCADVPVKEIEVVKKIVDLAERELDVSLSPTVYLTLAYHSFERRDRFYESPSTRNKKILSQRISNC